MTRTSEAGQPFPKAMLSALSTLVCAMAAFSALVAATCRSSMSEAYCGSLSSLVWPSDVLGSMPSAAARSAMAASSRSRSAPKRWASSLMRARLAVSSTSDGSPRSCPRSWNLERSSSSCCSLVSDFHQAATCLGSVPGPGTVAEVRMASTVFAQPGSAFAVSSKPGFTCASADA